MFKELENLDLSTQEKMLKFIGNYEVVCHDSDGNFKWKESVKNIVPNEGLNAFLQVFFSKVSPYPNFYIGLFAGNYTPVATDTMATFPSNATEFTGYSGNRPSFVIPASITGTSFDNSASPAAFTSTATSATTVYGAFLTTNNTQGGTTGVLLSAVKFGTSRTLNTGDVINVQYGLTVISS